MKIHFISVGGSVMHQLAIALKRKGYQITGSDEANLLVDGGVTAGTGHPDVMALFDMG